MSLFANNCPVVEKPNPWTGCSLYQWMLPSQWCNLLFVWRRGATHRWSPVWRERRHSGHVFMFPNWFTSIPTCSSCSGLCFVHTHTLGGVDACWKGGSSKIVPGNDAVHVCWRGGAELLLLSYWTWPVSQWEVEEGGCWFRACFCFFFLILKESEPGYLIVRIIVQTLFFVCVCVLCVIAPVKRGRREEFVHVDVQWTPSRLFISPEGSLCRSLFLFLAHSLSFFFSFSPVSFLWFHLPESHSDGCNRSQKALRVVETLSMKAFTVSPWLPPPPRDRSVRAMPFLWWKKEQDGGHHIKTGVVFRVLVQWWVCKGTLASSVSQETVRFGANHLPQMDVIPNQIITLRLEPLICVSRPLVPPSTVVVTGCAGDTVRVTHTRGSVCHSIASTIPELSLCVSLCVFDSVCVCVCSFSMLHSEDQKAHFTFKSEKICVLELELVRIWITGKLRTGLGMYWGHGLGLLSSQR